MKRKSTWILIAFLANLALLPLTIGAPDTKAQASRDAFFFNCCKETASGRPYCCVRCCFFTWNCLTNEDCEGRED